MKITNLIISAHIIAWIDSMSKTTSIYTANNHSSPSINTDDICPKHSTNVNYLKPFDTAFVAYYMMGLGNFK